MIAMTKADLLKIITDRKGEHEDFYLSSGPNKHEQEDHYQEGVSVVRMNVDLLASWIDELDESGEASDVWNSLPATEQRELWEASNFHFGIFGYDEDEADFFWGRR